MDLTVSFFICYTVHVSHSLDFVIKLLGVSKYQSPSFLLSFQMALNILESECLMFTFNTLSLQSLS